MPLTDNLNQPGMASAGEVMLAKNPQEPPSSSTPAGNDTGKRRIKTEAGGMTDAEIVTQITRYREESYERLILVRDQWLAAYDQYRNKQNFEDKAPWQSRITFSKAHAAIKHATANILRLLATSEQWLTVEAGADNEGLKTGAPIVEKAVLRLAESASTRSELRDSLENAFITGLGALKVGWDYDNRVDLSVGADDTGPVLVKKDVQEGHLAVNSIDPFHLWFGPRTKDRRRFDFIIEEFFADVAYVKGLQGIEDNSKLLENIEKIDDQSFFPDQQYLKDFQRFDQRNPTANRARKQVQLWEFWGDIIDPKTQTIVASDMHILVGNRTHILKYEKNPYWDGKPPYILYCPEIVASRFPGQGILEMNLTIKDAIDRIAQMQEDHLKFSVIPMLEVESSALENPEGDIQTGVQPGKVFYKRSGTNDSAVKGVQFPQLTNVSFNALLELDKEYQRGTFITEQTQGLVDSKGETTATEVNATQLQSSLILQDIATAIEDGCLSPLAEMIWHRAFQFMDSTTRPNWTSLLGPVLGKFLDDLPREMRIPLIQGRYIFKAHGLSRGIQRQQNMTKYVGLVQAFGQIGPQALAFLNMPGLLKRIFDAYHLPDPQELLAQNAQEMIGPMQAAAIASADPSSVPHTRAMGNLALASRKGDIETIQKLIAAHLPAAPPEPPFPVAPGPAAAAAPATLPQ